jgi:hypothetical protein
MSDDFTKVFAETLAELELEPKLEIAEEVEDTQEDIITETEELEEEISEEDDDSETEDEVDNSDDSNDSDESDDESVINLTEDDVIRLPDGTEVSVKEAALRQADYTKKTQALAERTKELEAQALQYTELESYVTSLREAWVNEPADVVANFLISSSDPTTVLAKALVSVAKQGKLEPKFLQQFGINEDVQKKWLEEADSNNELNSVKSRLEKVEAERQEQIAIQNANAEHERLVSQIEEQWEAVKTKFNINLGPKEELETKIQVLEYASLRNILDLETAYSAVQYENSLNKTAKKTSSKKTTGAVSKTSGAKQVIKKKPVESVEDALWETFNEISSKSK